MSEEKFSGVDILVERMQTHPEEFFESGEKRGRWAFMYKDYFKDCMTESEKGRIHEALKRVRRLEFDALVVKELMKDEAETEEKVKAAGLQPAPKKLIMNPSQIAAAKQQALANTTTPLNAEFEARIKQVQEDMHQKMIQRQWNSMVTKKP